MKKLSALLLVLLMLVTAVACKGETQKMTLKDFDELLSRQPVVIVDSQLINQTGNKANKRFYPDLLTCTVQNRTNKTITEMQVAFVGWDKDGNPAKIKSAKDKKGYDIKLLKYSDITVESGRYYGKGMGIELEPNHNITRFKAIVVRFKTDDGKTWENPYYNDFMNAFVKQNYRDSMMIMVSGKDDNFKVLSEKELEKTVMDAAAVEKKLAKIPVQVLSADYVVTGDNKDTTPDTIKAVFKNTGDKEIKKVVLCLLGFDRNGKAVKIREAGDNGIDGNFAVFVEYTTDGFVKDATAGENNAYQVNEACGIKYVKAVVKSYTDIDGKVYENPYFVDYCLIYEGGEIKVELPEEETIIEE